MIKVGIFRASDGACDFYRAVLPTLAAKRNGLMATSDLWVSNLYYETATISSKFKDTISSDIYLLQRFGGEGFMDKMKNFIKNSNLKTKIVLDHDDDIFHTSPFSEHYAQSGTEEIKIVHEGKVLHEWKDGFNIDLKKNRFRMDQMKRALEKSDLITVTNQNLANLIKPYNENIKILPNCLDINEWKRLNIIRENPDEVRIVWAGSQSHWEDLLMIRDPLIEVVNKHKNVKLVVIGYMPIGMKSNFPENQIEFHEWVETPAHPYRMAALDFDIGLVPLKLNQFNGCKSPIKWIEYSALKIPSVVSLVDPYTEIAGIDEDNAIFIDQNDKNGWLKGMELLINSPELRKKYGEKARKSVEDNFDINKKYKLWVDTYENLLKKEPVKGAV